MTTRQRRRAYAVLVTTNSTDPVGYGPFDEYEDAMVARAKIEDKFDEWTTRHDGSAEVIDLFVKGEGL